MQDRYTIGCSVTKVQYEKLKKIADYLRKMRGTNGSNADAMRCLINEVYAKIRIKKSYNHEEKK